VCLLIAGGYLCLLTGRAYPQDSLTDAPPDDSRVIIYSETDQRPHPQNQEIHYRVIIAWKGDDLDISYRIPKLPLSNLKLANVMQKGETQQDGNENFHKRILIYRLIPESVGEASVKKFIFEYTRADKTGVQRTEIGATRYNILPRKTKGLMLYWSIPVFVAAAGFAAGIVLMLKKNRKAAAPKRKISISPLEDNTILDLSRLESFLKESKTGEAMSKSGIIFRSYLQKKYELSAQKLTAEELLSLLERRRDIPTDERKKITDILHRISEAQFGGIAPTVEEASDLHEKICNFIVGKKVV